MANEKTHQSATTEQSAVSPPAPGWTVNHPRYGTWFISTAAVVEDWKKDHEQAYPGEPVPEPDEETIAIWFAEQISWIEVAALGTQLARPDFEAFEQAWLADMASNPDCASANWANAG